MTDKVRGRRGGSPSLEPGNLTCAVLPNARPHGRAHGATSLLFFLAPLLVDLCTTPLTTPVEMLSSLYCVLIHRFVVSSHVVHPPVERAWKRTSGAREGCTRILNPPGRPFMFSKRLLKHALRYSFGVGAMSGIAAGVRVSGD